jgi:hypothetical protein
MFYFFERQSTYVRCELRPSTGGQAVELILAEGDQPERVERYPNWEGADARWRQLKNQLQEDGWVGPLGRE